MPSSVIRNFAYDAPGQTLAVTFTNGRRYRYHDVPAETYAAMRSAFSKGEFFNPATISASRPRREAA